MEKGVAIPYIVALVIGMVVVVFIVYWVYKSFSSTVMSAQECKAKFIDWCTLCSNNNWAGGSLPSEIRNCLNTTYGINLPTTTNCQTAKDRCNSFGVK